MLAAYNQARLVCRAGGLIGKLPGEDSGVFAVRASIVEVDPGQHCPDVILVRLRVKAVMSAATQPGV